MLSNLETNRRRLEEVNEEIPLNLLRLKNSHVHSWKSDTEQGGNATETEPVEWDSDNTYNGISIEVKEASEPIVLPIQPVAMYIDDAFGPPKQNKSSNGRFKPNVSDDNEYSPTLPVAKEMEQPSYNHDWDDDEYTPEFPDAPLINEAKYDIPPPPMYNYEDLKATQTELPRSEAIRESRMPHAVIHTAREMKMSEKSIDQTADGTKITYASAGNGQRPKSASVRTEYTMVSPNGSNLSVNSTTSGTLLLMQQPGKNTLTTVKESAIQRPNSYDQDLLQRKKSIVFGKPDGNTDGAGCCGWVLYSFSILLIVVSLPFSLFFCIKVVQEYERAVIFRLGRLPLGGAKGPGIFFIIPCIESYSKIDLRTVSFDVPPQEVLTKDSVTVSVDAVVYYRVSNPTVSVANVENAHHSTRLLAQTTLRNILGTKNMSEILSDRESISQGMQSTLDEATDRWGIKVERVEIKDVRLPVQLQRAMAAEAEAAREARAKVIAAEGEHKASRALKDAADVMANSSAALQLRYLQTLSSISSEKNSTIIFPLPIDIMKTFMEKR